MLDRFLRLLGYGLCHQLPARSFFGGGHQLPVCARDTGIYIGFVASLVLIALLERGRRPTEFPRVWVMGLGVALLGWMAWDGLSSYAGLRETSNALRLATGMAAGWALPLLVVPMVNTSLWRAPGRGRVLDAWWEQAVWAACLPVAFAVSWFLLPATGIAYPLLVSAAILVTFLVVNLIIVSMLPAFERKADRLRSAWVAMLVSFAVGLAEIAATGGLRALLQSLSRLL